MLSYSFYLPLLGQYLYTEGVRIIGRWCSIPYTEAKDTLDSVPIWIFFILLSVAVVPALGILCLNTHPLSASITPVLYPTALARVLILSPSFTAPLAPPGFLASCHHQLQWNFISRPPPAGLQPISAWIPLTLLDRSPRNRGLAPPDLCWCWYLEAWGVGGASR